MKKLSGLDAAFLYLETETSPMQIGGVSILESHTPDGPLTLEGLKDLLRSRIHMSRTFTERLEEVPLGLSRPYWIEDPDFDLDRHVERTQLPEPGGFRELSALVTWEMSRLLPRDRPLWHLLLVEGLGEIEHIKPGSVALISRIHHAAIDGMSGTEIMRALYDPTPRPAPAAEKPRPRAAATAPSKLALLTGRGAAKDEEESGAGLGNLVRGALGGAVRSGATWAFQRVELPPVPFTAPRTVFNAPVPQERAWDCARLDLDRIKAVREATGATVNDVVLAVVAGALRAYLDERDELPEEPLVAMVPISVRSGAQRTSMGNQVSAMLVSLATDLDDPEARLRTVRQSADDSKVYHQAVGARALTDASGYIPFSVAGAASRLYSRMHLAEKHRPIFNLVITNVPGPQVPLYVAGARLQAHAGVAPIFDGIGLIVPVFSYCGRLAISFCSAPGLIDDIARLASLVETSLEELETSLEIR